MDEQFGEIDPPSILRADGYSLAPGGSPAGREMRDFATLIAALDGTGVRCHIAGSLVAGMDDRWRAELGDRGERVGLPDGVTFGPLTPVEMRELYARSRFVVLPLHPTDTDHGISCMLEAFAMARPVIEHNPAGSPERRAPGGSGSPRRIAATSAWPLRPA